MKKNEKVGASTKNSAKLQYNGKAVMVEYYNNILDHNVTALLPANAETKSLPYYVTREIVESMKAKYGSVTDFEKRKRQTAAAHTAMMARMTRIDFEQKWTGVRGIPDLREIKDLMVMARDSESVVTSAPHFASNEECNPAITKFRYSRDGNYARVFATINVGANTVFERCVKYGRYNTTKTSIDYDTLDVLFGDMEKVLSKLEEQREITVRLVRNGDGYDVILPQDLKIKEVRYE